VKKDMKFAAGLWIFSSCLDRFCTKGYKEETTLEKRIELAARVKDLRGVEICHPGETKNLDELKKLLKSHKLEVAMVATDVYSTPKWALGSFTSPKKEIRREAVEITKEAMDVSVELGCKRVSLWLGQDGFDYPFQVNYINAWDWLIEGIRSCADYNGKVTLFLEYKLKEPRTHCFISDIGKCLFLADQIGRKNIGITIDVGHALMAQENLAESFALVHRSKRELHMHFNDAYRYWDDDMIVGSIHFWEYLELMAWLQRLKYDGWYSLDMYPYREDPVKACEQSIRNLKWYAELVEKIGVNRIFEAIESKSIEETIEFLRESIRR
jgi:xylose isomerase